MNKAKYPLLSLISIILCGTIGFGWAELMLRSVETVMKLSTKITGGFGAGNMAILILLLLTFAAVSVIYTISEKLGKKYGFTKGEFFVWFAVIPFMAALILPLAMVSVILHSPMIIEYICVVFVLESVAYFLIMIFCAIRLIFCIIYHMLKKGESNGNNS